MKKHIIRTVAAALALCMCMTGFAACQKPQEKTYTVTYAAGEGTGTAPAPEQYSAGTEFTVRGNTFKYEGYKFKAWNDGEKDVAAGSAYTMPAKDVTFTAQWELIPVQKYTVTFSLGEYEGGTAPAPQTADKGTQITLPEVPSWEDHVFKGWSVDGSLKAAGEKFTLTADITVTAQWAIEDVYTGYWTATADGALFGMDDKSFDVELAAKLEGDILYLALIATEAVEGDAQPVRLGQAMALCQQDGKFSTGGRTAKSEGGKFSIPSGPDSAVEFTGRTPLGEDIAADATWEDAQEGFYLDIDGSAYDKGEGLSDAAYVRIGKYLAAYGKEAEKATPSAPVGGLFVVTEQEDALIAVTPEGRCYTLGSCARREQKHAFTAASIEADEETGRVYAVVEGTYEGYSPMGLRALYEDSDINAFKLSVCLGMTPWTYQQCDVLFEIAGGTIVAKIDVTDLEYDINFFILDDRSGSGDIKSIVCDTTLEAGPTKYHLHASTGSTLTITLGEAGKSFAVDRVELKEEGGKVYCIIGGTYEGYTDDGFAGLLGDTDLNVLSFGVTVVKEVKEEGVDKWSWPEVNSTVTAAQGTFTVTLEITDLVCTDYYVCADRSGSGDIKWDNSFAASLTFGGKKYELVKNAYGNTGLNVTKA